MAVSCLWMLEKAPNSREDNDFISHYYIRFSHDLDKIFNHNIFLESPINANQSDVYKFDTSMPTSTNYVILLIVFRCKMPAIMYEN